MRKTMLCMTFFLNYDPPFIIVKVNRASVKKPFLMYSLMNKNRYYAKDWRPLVSKALQIQVWGWVKSVHNFSSINLIATQIQSVNDALLIKQTLLSWPVNVQRHCLVNQWVPVHGWYQWHFTCTPVVSVEGLTVFSFILKNIFVWTI